MSDVDVWFIPINPVLEMKTWHDYPSQVNPIINYWGFSERKTIKENDCKQEADKIDANSTQAVMLHLKICDSCNSSKLRDI